MMEQPVPAARRPQVAAARAREAPTERTVLAAPRPRSSPPERAATAAAGRQLQRRPPAQLVQEQTTGAAGLLASESARAVGRKIQP